MDITIIAPIAVLSSLMTTQIINPIIVKITINPIIAILFPYSLQLAISTNPPTKPKLNGASKITGAKINNTNPTITVPKHTPNQAISSNIPPIINPAPKIILNIYILLPLTNCKPPLN